MSVPVKNRRVAKDAPNLSNTRKSATKTRAKTTRQKHEVHISTIFFPSDFSKHSKQLLATVAALCEKLQAKLVLFHAYKVAIVDEYMPATMVDTMMAEGEAAALKKLHALLPKDAYPNLDIQYSAKMGFTAECISDAALEANADLIVMGTNGCDSLEDRIFGTVSWNTIKHTSIPVLTLPEGIKTIAFQKIIFPFECTAKDLDIIQFCLKLAEIFGSTIYLIHFLLEGAVINKTILDKINTRFHKEISEERLQIHILADKNITGGISKFAERVNADTIIMVTHNRGLMATLFHMSTTRKMVLYNNTPLLAFKAE